MNYLRGFIPWLAFAVVSAAGWQWGALTALVLGAALLVQGFVTRIPMDSQILQISTIVYFAALTIFAFANPDSPLKSYVGALSMTWLALTAWGGLAAQRPFTLGIAKLQTPKELWDSPIFRKINVVITAAWAAAFTITAIVLVSFAAAGIGSAGMIPVQVAGFVIPAVFTARYPERVRARFAPSQEA
jgi:hypothetical protein